MAKADHATDLYRHYDANDRLLYVGISLSAANRFRGHKRTSAWASKAVKMTVKSYPTRREALFAEAVAIQDEGPLYNRDKPNPAEFAGPEPPVTLCQLCKDIPKICVTVPNNWCERKRSNEKWQARYVRLKTEEAERLGLPPINAKTLEEIEAKFQDGLRAAERAEEARDLRKMAQVLRRRKLPRSLLPSNGE